MAKQISDVLWENSDNQNTSNFKLSVSFCLLPTVKHVLKRMNKISYNFVWN